AGETRTDVPEAKDWQCDAIPAQGLLLSRAGHQIRRAQGLFASRHAVALFVLSARTRGGHRPPRGGRRLPPYLARERRVHPARRMVDRAAVRHRAARTATLSPD